MSLRRLLIGVAAAFIAVLVIPAGAQAGQVTGLTASPGSLSIQEGSSGTYNVAVTGISGNIPNNPPNAPEIMYCSAWTIHSDGSITCDTHMTIALQRNRNYTQHPLTATEIANLTRSVTVNVDGGLCGQTFTLTDTITLPAGSGTDFGDGVLSINRSVTVDVTCEPVPNGGCSHGYWKTHPSVWPAPYVEGTVLGTVFNLSSYPSIAGNTFKDALVFNGGPTVTDKAKLLLLQAVAGLLNAATPEVGYPLSQADVISQVNAALASGNSAQILALKDTLDGYNNLGSSVCQDPASAVQ